MWGDSVGREMTATSKIVITTGTPEGIGVEVTLKALEALQLPHDKVIIISHEDLPLPYEVIKIASEFEQLEKACSMGLPIVTAPVSKAALHAAGHKFNGQTEVLEHFLGGKAEMLFIAGKREEERGNSGMRVLFLTRHVPLKEVRLTKELIVEKVLRLNKHLKLFPVSSSLFPKIALCGLNPHAGENGILGTEEIDILIPAAQELREKGVNITDPLPADTLFLERDKYDCIVANYHDQGLIPIKTLYGHKVVNMTIGLPVLRTSPPHGTAPDIFGKGIADPTGMIEAVKTLVFENSLLSTQTAV
jgi:4-hydroxythreonine-4-phosphate dehydrogenase